MLIRAERPEDIAAIGELTTAAFKAASHSSGTEPGIVDALRAAGVLTLSLVAVEAGRVVGHVAFSPVRIETAEGDWYGLGPVSVEPARQGRGVGQALILAGLEQLKALKAAGCVVLGAPAYYGRFGFRSDPALRYGEAPAPYFQRLVFEGPPPSGQARYHPAFEA
jgi:predicted N-acetyltransferase YhbS